ncbi:hypothetical protein [Alkalihalophilus marmarensis]|uniref:hypothetical protein n=1 Tax=Alkalihalophilus marmarensis TaxID=521377 RepID=UPI002E1B7B6A|nr:hypothetical protein [Alkalihalophilus marmarensis]
MDKKEPIKLKRTVKEDYSGREGICRTTGSDYWMHKDVMEEEENEPTKANEPNLSDQMIIYNEKQTCDECGIKLPTKDMLTCQECIKKALWEGKSIPDGKIH